MATTGFDAVEAILAIWEALLKPAFDKRRSLSKRLPFILLYAVLGVTFVGFGTWLSLLLFSVGNLLLGIPVSIISVLLIATFALGPFAKISGEHRTK